MTYYVTSGTLNPTYSLKCLNPFATYTLVHQEADTLVLLTSVIMLRIYKSQPLQT